MKAQEGKTTHALWGARKTWNLFESPQQQPHQRSWKRAGNKKNKPANDQKENAKEEKKRKSDKRFFLFLLYIMLLPKKITRNLKVRRRRRISQPAFLAHSSIRELHRLFMFQILCNLRARARFPFCSGMPSIAFLPASLRDDLKIARLKKKCVETCSARIWEWLHYYRRYLCSACTEPIVKS